MQNIGIDQAVNLNEESITLVNGVTIDRIRTRYNWLLNAIVSDAIIGEDEHGLVWYSGDWVCGEWLGGTWYSGRFLDGTWYNGFFHSCKINEYDILNDKLTILEYNNTSSQFVNGVWENGHFYEGTFGENVDLSWEGDLSNKVAIWKKGTFHTGRFYDAKWYNGTFLSGYMKNSQWFNGEFFNGIFDGGNSSNDKSHWYKGNWYGGDFIRGIWVNGLFTKSSPNTISRFGYTSKNNIEDCLWKNGTFRGADFYSGSGCTNHGISKWLNGTFESGTWYGGTFQDGEWINGTWIDGIYGTDSTPWVYATGVYQSGDTIAWNNVENLSLSNDLPADISYLNSIVADGFISGNTLYFSGFTFGLTNLNANDIRIEGIELKIKRAGYYDNLDGGLIDLQINISNDTPITTTSSNECNIPYSYNNSYARETIFYGNRNTKWSIFPLDYTTIDDIIVTYTPNIKYSKNIKVTGYTYNIAAKVYYSTTPVWYNGTWYNGTWYCGNFKNGIFKNGIIFGGEFDNVDWS